MKSKLLKTMVLASSLAFMNCGDETVTSAFSNYAAGFSSSSASEVLPGTETEISSSDAVQQGGNELLPGSSDSFEIGSSDSVPGSSADV